MRTIKNSFPIGLGGTHCREKIVDLNILGGYAILRSAESAPGRDTLRQRDILLKKGPFLLFFLGKVGAYRDIGQIEAEGTSPKGRRVQRCNFIEISERVLTPPVTSYWVLGPLFCWAHCCCICPSPPRTDR